MSLVALDLLEKNFLKIEKNDSLSRLIGKMISSKKDSALVFEGDSFSGIVSRKALARKKINNPAKIKISAFLENVPVLEPSTPLEKIAELMFSSDARILPVSKDAEIIGIVADLEVARAISSLPEIQKTTVKEIFSKTVALQKDSTVAQALSLMREKQLNGIPIVEQNSLVGFVSLSDIAEKFFLFPKERQRGARLSSAMHSQGFDAEKSALSSTPISNEMAWNVATITPNETVAKAAMLMNSKNTNTLVVLDESNVLGIVSARDILACFKKLVSERNIQISAMPAVDEIDRAKIMNTINASYDKISRIVPGQLSLHVHFKEHGKSGIRKKHTVHLKLSHSGKPIVSKSFDWKLLSALQGAISSLERETINSVKRR